MEQLIASGKAANKIKKPILPIHGKFNFFPKYEQTIKGVLNSIWEKN